MLHAKLIMGFLLHQIKFTMWIFDNKCSIKISIDACLRNIIDYYFRITLFIVAPFEIATLQCRNNDEVLQLTWFGELGLIQNFN